MAAAVKASPVDNNVSSTQSVQLSIKILRSRGLRGTKGEHVNSLVRTQFADFDFKDSEVVNDSPHPEYNHEQVLTLNVDDRLLDTFANRPLTVTWIEQLPKEKTLVLGTADIPLFHPFVSSFGKELSIKKTIPINYLNPRLLPTPAPAADGSLQGPQCDIEVTLSHSLLPSEIYESGNFMTLTVDEAFPLPEEWSLKEGNEKDLNSNIYSYTLNVLLPVDGSKNRIVSISGGVLKEGAIQAEAKPTDAQENANNASAASNPSAAAPAIATPANAPSESTPNATGTRKIIDWKQSRKFWLNPDAVSRLRDMITKKNPIAMELVRELQPRFAHLNETAGTNKYRGRLQIDCASLLFPRVTSLKGRFSVESTEAPLPVDAIESGANAAATVAVNEKSHKSQDATKKTPAAKPNAPGASESSGPNLYRQLGTQIGIEVALEKPLLDKKKLQPITKNVRDFIPHRPPNAQILQQRRAAKASLNYRQQVHRLAENIIDQYVALEPSPQDSSNDQDAETKRRKQLLFSMNRSGLYYQMKEQLKTSVIDIVREHFQKRSAFATKVEMENFMNEVYVYLVDQMHSVLNQMYDDQGVHVGVEALQGLEETLQSLKKTADAAEKDRDFEAATKAHLERIAKSEDSLQLWYDFACYCLRSHALEKAEECFRHILSRDAQHLQSLLAYGIYLCTKERYEETHVFLRTAIDSHPEDPLPLSLLAFYYEQIGEEVEAEHVLEQASKLTNGVTDYDTLSAFALSIQADKLAEKVLGQDLLANGPHVRPYLRLAKLALQRGSFEKAEEHVKRVLELQQDNTDAWAICGHAHHFRQQFREAQQAYETVLSLPQEPEDLEQVYLRLGAIHLKRSHSSQDVTLAKSMYLRACRISPSCASWLGVGIACLRLQEYDAAEDALAEANVLDPKQSTVWAYLTLLCLVQGRLTEANQALRQVLKLGLPNASLFREIGESYLNAGERHEAAECFRLSLALEDNSEVRDLFARALIDVSSGNAVAPAPITTTKPSINRTAGNPTSTTTATANNVTPAAAGGVTALLDANKQQRVGSADSNKTADATGSTQGSAARIGSTGKSQRPVASSGANKQATPVNAPAPVQATRQHVNSGKSSRGAGV